MLMDSKVIVKKPEDLLGPLNQVESKFAPKELFLRGDLELFEAGPRVSLVGSRNPSEQGHKDTVALIKALVKDNVVIVSGLATGIDTIAHKTTMSEGGHTIAVLGTPLNYCYPHENFELQQIICKDHLAITQFAEGSPVQRMNFPQRNRTMALISHATIIVEAGKTSGTIHQGWEALRLGRPLFIMDRLVDNKEISWAQEMVNYGAIPLSTSHIQRVLETLPASGSRFIDVTLPT